MISFSFYWIFFSKYYWDGPDEKKISIAKGTGLNVIIDELEKNDIIADRSLFKIAAVLTFKDDNIISNSYLLTNGMSNYDLLKILTDNTVSLVKITIPEGFTLKKIAALTSAKLKLSENKILKEAENDSLINLLRLNNKIKNLEGFLFPATYEVSPQISEKVLIETLFEGFEKNVLTKIGIDYTQDGNADSLLKIITLASIIEGETKIDAEKPVVSGVYHNRLKRNMRLEADPTVQYVIPDGPKSRLLFEDLKFNSPYNTYQNKGLPPGPINNPGLKSIQAAENPADHKYIFFVATGEGGHNFSETYDQHLNAIKDYKKKLKEIKQKKEEEKNK